MRGGLFQVVAIIVMAGVLAVQGRFDAMTTCAVGAIVIMAMRSIELERRDDEDDS